MSDLDSPTGESPSPEPDLASLGLEGLDPAQLIQSSSFCSMVHASHQLVREIAPELGRVDLTPSLFLVLGQILAAPGSSQADIARAVGMLPQTIAAILDGAEARGLLTRGGPRGRGRVSHVFITTAGVELLMAGWPAVQAAGGDRLTPGQHVVLQGLLSDLRGGAVDEDDVVVLVDEDGRDAGTWPRATVHTADTPLHRAFSTYLRDADGRLLLTRRSLHKKTWPGVWTNAACGHLAPGETPEEAALRRVPDELGTSPRDLQVVLPAFRYRAVDASGVVEHEVCPVMVGVIDAEAVSPNPLEVAEHTWVAWEDLVEVVRRTPALLSPWCVEQVLAMGERPW